MPASFHPAIIERAKVMFTVEGRSPNEIVQDLLFELGNGKLPVPPNIRLPADRSTVNRWAKEGAWKPNWKLAKKQVAQSEDGTAPFEISGITDPIWHLSKTLAFRKAREYAIDRRFRSEPVVAVVMAIQMEVAQEYDPGPRVHRNLRQELRRHVRDAKKDAMEVGPQQHLQDD